MSALYECHALRQCYGDKTALALANFYLQKGETVTLTGANGSGKSTLLRLLAFLEKPSSGTLRYYGPDKENPRRAVTLLLQEPFLFRENVFRNVVLGLLLRGQKDSLALRYEQAMRLAGFERPGEFAQRRQSALSGGEKQRVALASRLILQPAVLLLDEPTAYVDAASARIIISALQSISSKGAGIVCATHDQALLLALNARNVELAAVDG